MSSNQKLSLNRLAQYFFSVDGDAGGHAGEECGNGRGLVRLVARRRKRPKRRRNVNLRAWNKAHGIKPKKKCNYWCRMKRRAKKTFHKIHKVIKKVTRHPILKKLFHTVKGGLMNKLKCISEEDKKTCVMNAVRKTGTAAVSASRSIAMAHGSKMVAKVTGGNKHVAAAISVARGHLEAGAKSCAGAKGIGGMAACAGKAVSASKGDMLHAGKNAALGALGAA
jgi:hypothetical protein